MPFVKGQSGNPGGREKKNPEFVASCKKLTPKALKYLERVLDNEDEETRDRIKAATVIIEHAHGKPAQAMDVTSAGNGVPFVVQISPHITTSDDPI